MKTTFSIGDWILFADYPRNSGMREETEWTEGVIIKFRDNDTYQIEYYDDGDPNKISRLACDMMTIITDSDIDEMVGL